MSPLSDVASLAIAGLSLLEVQDVIGAMRAADAEVQGGGRPPLSPLPIVDQARHIHPDPIYSKPQVIHSAPVYADRQVIHQTPRFAVRPALAPAQAVEPVKCHALTPIKPVWSVLPWQEPVNPAIRVKVVQYRTDILHKGSLIDMFI